ncbi:MAG: hypothetical protein BAJALOKI2v1_1110002 [Promethearchaeota archaeon]|nr:MAG: hypothetical protein BAJALOKI2v1_1110002 [Candidatus Lokiarchaeota archaeon]
MVEQIATLSKKNLLERADDFIFSTGVDDGASQLAKKNMRYGIAQMHIILEKYGFEPKASFISTPDETISRNVYRWNSGFGYGGRISWGGGNNKIIFLNTKPNQCGILVGGLEYVPELKELIKKINIINQEELYYQDILLNLDYGVSNHFINCFKTKNMGEINFPPYIFMIHGSAPEVRDDTYGLGMYVDSSKNLKDRAIKEETIFGTQFILLDDAASEYMKLNNKIVKFANIKRKIFAEHIFGEDYKLICSQPHQFLYDYNNIYLGCNCTDINSELVENNFFPIALRADAPAYLFRGKRNFSDSVIRKLNFYERADKLGLMNLLKNANVLPHGGGYCFPDIKKVTKVLEINKKRYFVCELNGSDGKKIFRNAKNLQYEYRSEKIIEEVIKLNLGEGIAKLEPLYSLKV